MVFWAGLTMAAAAANANPVQHKTAIIRTASMRLARFKVGLLLSLMYISA
jgi:hypothetical protein